ncbi:MAG TPA: CARDB domain-containing protein [Candidatus Bathyarchaeia archaeon]|nr:CARDB domain-containing protein [Candidatus Bathyarchaeia archaeon]
MSPIVWSSEKPLPTNTSYYDGSASVTQTSDGKIWVVWDKEVQSRWSIFYTTSSDYGATWALEQNLTAVPSQDFNKDPSIVQLSNGTIIVVWAAQKNPPLLPNDFEMSASPNALTIPRGSSGFSNITVHSLNGFSDLVSLSTRIGPPTPHITTGFSPPQVTPPPNGNAYSGLTINVGVQTPVGTYTVTVRGYNQALDVTRTTIVTVTVPSTLSSPSSMVSDFSPAAEPTQSPYELVYRTSSDNGTTWSAEKKLPLDDASGDNLAPSIMQAANGSIWLVWVSGRTGNSELYYKTSPDGISWSSDFRLTYNASVDGSPSIAQMQNGNIWVVWSTDRFGLNEELIYNVYNGTSWLGEQRLTSTVDYIDVYPAILQAWNGTIRVFWTIIGVPGDGTGDIYYVESNNNGTSWSSPIPFTTDTREDQWVAVAESVDTRMWVVWTSNRTGGFDLYYRTSLVHNLAVTVVDPSPLRVYQKENVTIDVTVRNWGDFGESFTLSCYANTTLVYSRPVTLASGAWTTVTFGWNTSGFERGNYYVTAVASVVLGEIYAGDNSLTHSTIRVKLLGDVDDSGLVNTRDMFNLGKAFGSVPGNPNWNEEADMNGDNAVNTVDLSELVGNFGATG